jgi:hypothetical protein
VEKVYNVTNTKQKLVARIALVGILLSIIPVSNSAAAQITTRSLTLGSSASNVNTTYSFTYTVPTATAIKAIRYQFCTTANGACVVPNAWVNTGATLTSFPNAGTGFTVDLATNSDSLGMTSASNSTAPTSPITVLFSNVKTPTLTTQPFTFYVRISTYSGVGYTGALDTGVVAAAIVNQITLTGTMPESLIFCTGATVTGTDCSTATSGAVSFNQDFSPTATATATSQMVASTNAGTGYSITVNGTTMTSGANTIPAMGTATTSVIGSGQFGLNVMSNTTPAIGAAITPAANGTNLRGQGLTGYNTADTFKFLTGDAVANSGNASLGASDAQNYTVSYLVNVSGSQTAGIYTTTLSYICTATF